MGALATLIVRSGVALLMMASGGAAALAQEAELPALVVTAPAAPAIDAASETRIGAAAIARAPGFAGPARCWRRRRA